MDENTADVIAQLDADIAKIDTILDAFTAQWPVAGTEPAEVSDAWNMLHDAHTSLTSARAKVAQ